MSANNTTFIDTNLLPRLKTEQGEVTEILNRDLAGAENVLCNLRWLKDGEQFATAITDKQQLVYLMEGKGRIRLEGRDHAVSKGGGVYLGPFETAVITPDPGVSLKLFHIHVSKIPT
ncbi:MAG: AraC family ligand binding domain-containing protein [Terriglobales bacterium]